MEIPMNLDAIRAAWTVLKQTADIGPIRDAGHYSRMVELADALVDSGQAEAGAALEDLFVVVTELIADFDRRHFVIPMLPPRELLHFLMEQHGLTQSDLPEVGNQSVVSQVLSGKRRLTARHVALLSKRFGIPADAFIDKMVDAA
jgi:HTH-type transcriptional regulator/antitoxin HigA